MVDKWKTLSPKEKMQYKLVLLFLIAGIYGLVFYPSTHERYFEAKKLLHRKQNRIESRTEIGDIKNSGASPKTLKKKIEEVQEEITAIGSSFDELDTGFAPIDSTEVQQQLLLEVSKLAERAGIELISVAKKGYTRDGEFSIAPVDPVLRRPLLVVIANANYFGLLNFLHGFKELSFYVSVMNLKIYTDLSQEQQSTMRIPKREVPPGVLTVVMELSI